MSQTPDEAAPENPAKNGSGTAIHSTLEASVSVAARANEAPWLGSLWARIKEHKIAQWTLAYAAFAFASLHAATLLSDALEWPHSIVRAVTLLLMIGLPIAPILAWYHGVRALRRVSIPELILIALLLVIGGALLWRSPRPAAGPVRVEAASPAGAATVKPDGVTVVFAPPAHSIAVLPFVNMSGDPKQEYFSDGISEELLNSLSRLEQLQSPQELPRSPSKARTSMCRPSPAS